MYDDLVPTTTSPSTTGGRRDLPPPGAYQLHSDGTLTRLHSVHSGSLGGGSPGDEEQAPPPTTLLDAAATSRDVGVSGGNDDGLIEAHTVDDVVEVHAKPIEWWTPRKTIMVVGGALVVLIIIVAISVTSVNKKRNDVEIRIAPTLPPEERFQVITDILLIHGYYNQSDMMLRSNNITLDGDVDDSGNNSTNYNATEVDVTDIMEIQSILMDPTTPQYKALNWLALEDPYTVPVDDIDHLKQRYALAVLYFATGGNDTWIDSFEFLSAEHECSWSGALSCGQENSNVIGENDSTDVVITGIHLQGNDLVGALPVVELSFLSDLRHLDVGVNLLSGALPSNLPGQLTYLELYKNEFTGTLPDTYSEMVELEYLRASFNHLSGTLPQNIGALTKLTNLNLEENFLTGSFPDSIWNLSHLEVFNFDTQREMTGTISTMIGNFRNLTILLVNTLNGLTGKSTLEKVSYAVCVCRVGPKRLTRTFFYRYSTGSIPTEVGYLTKLVEFKTAQSHMSGKYIEFQYIYCVFCSFK